MSHRVLNLTLGASNHTEKERQVDDYYATEPKAVELLLEREHFSNKILEPMCGGGHISEVLKAHGYNVVSTDKTNYGYGSVKDLFDYTFFDGDIISNPPYKQALECIKHCLDIVDNGSKVAMFLKIQFLEGKQRGEFYKDNPPKFIYVARRRLNCAMNGDFETYDKNSAIAYAWFVWEKGYKGEPMIRWIN